MNYAHVMLDLETLGNTNNCIITSIGAAHFDITTGKVLSTFEVKINPNSCRRFGLEIDPDTFLWWMKQPEESRIDLLECEKGVALEDALGKFSSWMQWLIDDYTTPGTSARVTIQQIQVWGRGPRFDQGILLNAYQKTRMTPPWLPKNELCVRTMEFLRPEIKKSWEHKGIIHNPLHDSVNQLSYVSEIYQNLN